MPKCRYTVALSKLYKGERVDRSLISGVSNIYIHSLAATIAHPYLSYNSHESERPKMLYRLFAMLSYAKSLTNLQPPIAKNRIINFHCSAHLFQNYSNKEGTTYWGTNCRKNASWGKGRSMYSIILRTASDLIYDRSLNVKDCNLGLRSIFHRPGSPPIEYHSSCAATT